MRRTLTSKTTLESLRKEAKRWLKALRAGDAGAHARLQAASPAAPATPGLRDVQHALALEYGLDGWIALKAALAGSARPSESDTDRIDTLLGHGWTGDTAAAERILAHHPDLARANLFTAATCGLPDEVERHLASDAMAAARIGGARRWPALAYVTYGRLDPTNAVAIAHRLLAAGADPNFGFDDGWGSPFTVLAGAIGLGEQLKTSHAQATALVELLVESGARAYDLQALYNVSVAGAETYWYDQLWRLCEREGTLDHWTVRGEGRLGAHLGKNTLDYLLGNAVGQNHVSRAAWLLERGADASTGHAYTKQALHKLAQLSGFAEMVALLEAHGASPVHLTGLEALIAAAMRHDEDTVRAVLVSIPSLIRDPHPLLAAAMHGDADATALLLSLGADPRVVDREGISPLHRAVQAGSLEVADLLLAAGAEIDLRERKWRGTPLSWSVVLKQPLMAQKLAPLSRDVRALASLPDLPRLAAVLATMPELANHRLDVEERPTPLYCLPDEEEAASEVAELLLHHGADPAARNREDQTPADVARKRGLDDAADLIEATGAAP